MRLLPLLIVLILVPFVLASSIYTINLADEPVYALNLEEGDSVRLDFGDEELTVIRINSLNEEKQKAKISVITEEYSYTYTIVSISEPVDIDFGAGKNISVIPYRIKDDKIFLVFANLNFEESIISRPEIPEEEPEEEIVPEEGVPGEEEETLPEEEPEEIPEEEGLDIGVLINKKEGITTITLGLGGDSIEYTLDTTDEEEIYQDLVNKLPGKLIDEIKDVVTIEIEEAEEEEIPEEAEEEEQPREGFNLWWLILIIIVVIIVFSLRPVRRGIRRSAIRWRRRRRYKDLTK